MERSGEDPLFRGDIEQGLGRIGTEERCEINGCKYIQLNVSLFAVHFLPLCQYYVGKIVITLSST